MSENKEYKENISYASIDDDSNLSSLNEWKNPPTVKDLKKDYTSALPMHKEQMEKIDEYIALLEGDEDIGVNINEKGEGDGNTSKVQPKLARKQAEWRYSGLEESIIATKRLFHVRPATKFDVDAARQNTLILNKQFRIDIERIPFINTFVRNAVNLGTVVIEVGWENKTGIVKEERFEPIYAQTEEDFMVAVQMMVQNGMNEQQIAEVLQSGSLIQIGEQKIIEEVEKEIVNRPILENKDIHDIIVDPTCEGNIKKANFIINRFVTTLSALEAERVSGKNYHNIDLLKEKLESGVIAESVDIIDERDANLPVEANNFKFEDKARKKLVAYEHWVDWDINDDGTTVAIVATYVEDIMIRLEENPFPDKRPPFVFGKYLPSIKPSVYGEPDVALIDDNQRLIGALTRGMINLFAKSANSQVGTATGWLTPKNQERFDNGQRFEYNPVQGTPMMQMTFPEIPQSVFQVIAQQQIEAESLTGVKSFDNGISGNAYGSTATGVRSALGATQKRESSILGRLTTCLEEVGRKIMLLNLELLSDEEIIRITDEEFIAVKRDELAGTFDLDVTIQTIDSNNDKAEFLGFIMQTGMQGMNPDLGQQAFAEMIDLKNMPEFAQQMREYKPPEPSESELRKMELELALLEANIELVRAETQKNLSQAGENEVDMRVKEAKVTNTEAQTRKINSESDQLDANYVNEMNGVQQRRDLEKMAMQSKLNGDEAMLTNALQGQQQAQQMQQQAAQDPSKLIRDAIVVAANQRGNSSE